MKFQMYIQPIFDLLENRVFEYEFLLRTEDSVSREISFPHLGWKDLLTDSRIYQDFSSWMVKEIQLQMNLLPNDRFAINFSNQQLGFPASMEVLEVLKNQANRLTVELTEDIAEGSYLEKEKQESNVFEQIKAIHNMGYEISMDDVGCGINNLLRIAEFMPLLSEIKFTVLPFVEKTLNHESLMIIINFLKEFSQYNQKRLVVEGIEDTGMLEELRKSGVRFVQGYCIDQPFAL